MSEQRTYEATYKAGALCGLFLVAATNPRRARNLATDYLAVCGLLPVEELKIRLKTSGLQLDPAHGATAGVFE